MFGGNPDNITIFGESAGAVAVGDQINAFGGSIPVPFHRAIMQSGEATSNPGTDGELSTQRTLEVAELLNCTSDDTAAQLQCLRDVPLDEMLPIVNNYQTVVSPSGAHVWQPIAKGPFMPAAPSHLLRAGRFAHNIDLIVGWNKDDGTLFLPPNISTDDQVVSAVIAPCTLEEASKEALLALYPLSKFAPIQSAGVNLTTSQFSRGAAMWRDSYFLCPALLLAQTMRNSSPSTRTYLYEMNTTVFVSWYASLNASFRGIGHGSDIPFVFNDVYEYQPSVTEAQEQLASQMAASWASFANVGIPTVGNGTLTEWNAYDGESDKFDVRIIGGPYDGMASIDESKQSVLAGDEILQRCGFWNSPEIMNQIGK